MPHCRIARPTSWPSCCRYLGRTGTSRPPWSCMPQHGKRKGHTTISFLTLSPPPPPPKTHIKRVCQVVPAVRVWRLGSRASGLGSGFGLLWVWDVLRTVLASSQLRPGVRRDDKSSDGHLQHGRMAVTEGGDLCKSGGLLTAASVEHFNASSFQ